MLKLKFAIFGIVLQFLNRHYLKVENAKALIHAWIGSVRNRAETRGTVDTIGWIKLIRLTVTRYLCGQPFSTSPGLGIQLTPEGLPITGVQLEQLFRDMNPPHVRLGMTLLGLSRILPGWKSPDLAPIIDPPASTKLSYYGLALSGIVKELGWKLTQPCWEECHTTTKAGPNAQALVGSIEDAHLLSDTEIENLRILGGDELIRSIETSRLIQPLAWLEVLGLKPKGFKSKLSLVKDKEAKCRIVAILDYWSQSALKPLHEALMSFLRGLKGDCTFNQGGFRACLPQSGPYHSLDLTSATDRLPIAIQVPVLATLVGSMEYAEAWRVTCVDREFRTTWGNRSVVRYGAGQPMGAYSSWAMFTVTHHAIVRLAALRAGFNPRWSGYALLGDDIVISNDAVAEQYRTILADLGVSISEQKTHVSRDTYEFAKRWIQRGIEVTGAPMGSMFEAITFVSRKTRESLGGNFIPTKAIKRISFYEVATWFRELELRWVPRTYTLVSRGLLVSFFLSLGRGALSERLADKAWKFYLLPSREDSKLLRHTKCDALGRILLEGSLGCFSWRKATERICVLLNECKARVLEEAIKRQVGTLQRFQLEGAKYAHLIEGSDAQSVLLALPPFAVVRGNIAQLQLEFDKAHRVRDSDDISQWLHLDVRLFLDPFAALSKRQSKIAASNKATVLNYLTSMCRGIEEARALALLPTDLNWFVNEVLTRDITPSRGDARRRRPRPRPLASLTAVKEEIVNVEGVGTKS
jgi:hypothetical protein